MSTHQHMCGHTDFMALLMAESPLGAKGCGHVWEHADQEASFDSEKQWRDLHTCPNCGQSAWTLKYFGVRSDENGTNRREHLRAGLKAELAKQQAQARKGNGPELARDCLSDF